MVRKQAVETISALIYDAEEHTSQADDALTEVLCALQDGTAPDKGARDALRYLTKAYRTLQKALDKAGALDAQATSEVLAAKKRAASKKAKKGGKKAKKK